MANGIVRLAEVRVYEGTDSVPAIPKRCWREIAGYESAPLSPSSDGSVGQASTNIDFAEYYNQAIQQAARSSSGYGNSIGSESGSWAGPVWASYAPITGGTQATRRPIYRTVCDPAQSTPGVDGTPPRVVVNDGPDWHSHARSNAALPGPGRFSCSVTDGVIVGFTKTLGTTGIRSISPNNVLYGALIKATGVVDEFNVYEIVGGSTSASPVGLMYAEERLNIERTEYRCKLFSTFETDTYPISETTLTLDGPLFVAGFLQDLTAKVDDPSFTEYSLVTGAPPPVTLGLLADEPTPKAILHVGAETALPLAATVVTKINGALQLFASARLPLTAEVYSKHSYQIDGAEATLPLGSAVTDRVWQPDGARLVPAPMVVLAGNAPGLSAALYPAPMTIYATTADDAPVPTLTGARLYPSDQVGYATVLNGTAGGVDVTLPKQLYYISDYEYTEVDLRPAQQVMFASAPIGPPNYYGYMDALFGYDGFATDFTITVSFESTVTLETEASLLLLLDAALETTLGLTDELSLASILTAAIESGLEARTIADQLFRPEEQLIYNLQTEAVTRVTGMDFTKIQRAGDYTYGIKSDGVYRIGRSDQAECISGLIEYGGTAFGSSAKKHIDAVYIGVATDGEVYLKLTADGVKERVYKAIQSRPTAKVRTGRGLTAREWGITLQVMDATDAQLDEVEFVVATATRRWTR